MRFSECFGVDDPKPLDWFDPHLKVDTLLFVDPFLLFEDKEERWKQSHDKIMDYFQESFELLARSDLRSGSQYYRRVLELMMFPEPREFRLGFSSEKFTGAGSGKGLAKLIVEAMCEAVKHGTENIKHFEELGILVEGINRDRISDITCNLLKSDFIKYTQESCLALGIPLQRTSVPHSCFDSGRRRWVGAEWELPVDPESDVPVLLTPKRFLRELPTLNTGGWKEFVNSELRDDLNLRISEKLDKKTIIRLARQYPDRLRQWVSKVEQQGSRPYDVDNDPKLKVRWYEGARRLVAEHPLDVGHVQTEDELHDFLNAALKQFVHFVEEQGGWRLLWSPSYAKAVPETNIQLLLKGVIEGYCRRVGVTVDREVELGRGPVDFAFSSSARVRTLLEIKKLENGRFWSGIEAQLPSYLKSDQRKSGWVAAVRFSDTLPMRERWRKIPERATVMHDGEPFEVRIVKIDALPKDSASKLRSDPQSLDDEGEGDLGESNEEG